MDFPDGGGCGLRTVPIPGAYLEYDPEADTLVDWSGITWFRAP